MTTLELRSGYRERSRCSYWDIYVDGKRIADEFDVRDFIPPLGWFATNAERHFVLMLLRKTTGELAGGRVPILVCPECADYGCDVFSCLVERTESGIVWREFGMQTGDNPDVCVDDLDSSISFTFDPAQYYNAFAGRLPGALP